MCLWNKNIYLEKPNGVLRASVLLPAEMQRASKCPVPAEMSCPDQRCSHTPLLPSPAQFSASAVRQKISSWTSEQQFGISSYKAGKHDFHVSCQNGPIFCNDKKRQNLKIHTVTYTELTMPRTEKLNWKNKLLTFSHFFPIFFSRVTPPSVLT